MEKWEGGNELPGSVAVHQEDPRLTGQLQQRLEFYREVRNREVHTGLPKVFKTRERPSFFPLPPALGPCTVLEFYVWAHYWGFISI